MSVAYATPIYVVTSTVLCLIYSCITCVKDKGKLQTSDKAILFGWCLISTIIASFVACISGEIMTRTIAVSHLLIVLLIVCVSLSVSSSLIYWS